MDGADLAARQSVGGDFELRDQRIGGGVAGGQDLRLLLLPIASKPGRSDQIGRPNRAGSHDLGVDRIVDAGMYEAPALDLAGWHGQCRLDHSVDAGELSVGISDRWRKQLQPEILNDPGTDRLARFRQRARPGRVCTRIGRIAAFGAVDSRRGVDLLSGAAGLAWFVSEAGIGNLLEKNQSFRKRRTMGVVQDRVDVSLWPRILRGGRLVCSVAPDDENTRRSAGDLHRR